MRNESQPDPRKEGEAKKTSDAKFEKKNPVFLE